MTRGPSVLSTVIIAADDYRRQILQALAIDSGRLMVHTASGRYPAVAEAQRLTKLADPDVLFLDLKSLDAAVGVLNVLRLAWPRAVVLGVGPPPGLSIDGMGLSGFVPFPPQPHEFQTAVAQAVRRRRGDTLRGLNVFLPAKAGLGASTIVWQTALRLARDLQKRTLVLDADLRSGTLSLMLNREPQGSTQSALRSIRESEEHRLAQAITSVAGVDWLLSTRHAMEVLPDWTQYHALLQHFAPQYDAMLADLPELINEATAEVVLRAERVFLVTTQEIIPLKLAEQRLRDFEAWGVPRDRVRILLNRHHRQELSIPEVADFLGAPVEQTFPNNYPEIRRTLKHGIPVPDSNALGRAYREFAASLATDPLATPTGSAGGLLPKLFGSFRRQSA